MASAERLTEITAELKSMDDGMSDVEYAHVRADHLLVEALRLVCNLDVYTTNQIEDLLSAYAGVPKWYA